MNQSLPILYSFRRCPYAMRARLALAKSGLCVELREVVLRDKPQSLLSVSPKGTVPVLILKDETVLEESLEIMHWALKKNDPDQWLKKMNLELINENDSSFKKNLDRYKYFNRHPEHSQDYYRDQAKAFLQKLETILEKNPFLTGEEIKFIDIAIFPFIRQFAGVEPQWFATSEYVSIRRWLEHFSNSSLFKQSMFKYDQWNLDQEPVFFPTNKVE